jgi:lipoprotein NlpI/transglutaminase-like putative cysteine protease
MFHRRLVAALAATAIVLQLALLPEAQAQDTGQPARVKEIQLAADAFQLDDRMPSWADLVDLPDADASLPLQIRLIDTQYHIELTTQTFVRRAMSVNSASALSSAGRLEVRFFPQYQKVALHAVRIHRGGLVLDRRADASIRYLQRERDLERGVYSGEVTASILVNDLRVGDTLDLAYTITGQNPVFDGVFTDVTSWDAGFQPRLRRLILNHPENRRIAHRVNGNVSLGAIEPKTSTANGIHRLVFEERDLPRILSEPGVPPGAEPYRWLQLSEFATWQDLAVWAARLFKVGEAPGPELTSIVERLGKLQDQEAQIEAALRFVQNEVRYFSVSLGESSHRPTSPNAVLERRYGDCKDKSLLLMTILSALGIEARPVLLQAASRQAFDKLLPSPLLFDHAIVEVRVDGSTYFLDPTRLGQYGRLATMGQAHDGANVLIAAPETTGLVTIQSPKNTQTGRNEVIERIELGKLDGEAVFESTQVWYGVNAESLRLLLDRLPLPQLGRSLAQEIESRYPGAAIKGDPVVSDDRVNNVLKIVATLTVPGIARQENGNWFIPFTAVNLKGVLAPVPPAARKAPISMPKFPFNAFYTFEAKLPPEVAQIADPQSWSVKDKHFTYHQSTYFRGNQFKSQTELVAMAPVIEPGDFAAYTKAITELNKTGVNVVVIPKALIKPGAAQVVQEVGDRMAAQAKQTIDLVSKAISGGKLAGKELADAYCLRSMNHSSLAAHAKALADAGKALALNPEASSCRGYAYMFAGQFEKADADYSRAIAGKSDEDGNYLERGIVRLYSGRLEAARDDFTRAANTDKQEKRVVAELWLAAVYRRLGQPLPPDVVKRAADNPQGEWPRPALAMAAGVISPQDMLQIMGKKSGDDLKMAQSEGFFFLGQHYLAKGETSDARAYFEKARAQNVIIYLEHIAAGFELKRLASPAARSQTKPPATAKPTAKSSTAGHARSDADTSGIWGTQQ